jgi:hypothetical protein
MSWQELLETKLIKLNVVDKGFIVGIDGQMWASCNNFVVRFLPFAMVPAANGLTRRSVKTKLRGY